MSISGRVIKSTGSWYVVRTNTGQEVDARLRGRFKLEDKKITNPIAVGDWVTIEEEKGGEKVWVISAIEPRENYIIRKSPKKTAHGHILAANLDQAIVLATMSNPKTSTGFIDRFLVTAESYRIPTLIIFNKSDLLSETELAEVNHLRVQYEQIGYSTMLISAIDPTDVEKLQKVLLEKFTLVAGHSGVGKSTLINTLIPSIKQQTANISNFSSKGVHTTTFAEVFTLAANSYIIDSPGIKELGIMEIEKHELSHYFPEMRMHLGNCKFNNCMHVNEPGCKVLDALQNNEIWDSRFASYLSILEDHDNRR